MWVASSKDAEQEIEILSDKQRTRADSPVRTGASANTTLIDPPSAVRNVEAPPWRWRNTRKRQKAVSHDEQRKKWGRTSVDSTQIARAALNESEKKTIDKKG